MVEATYSTVSTSTRWCYGVLAFFCCVSLSFGFSLDVRTTQHGKCTTKLPSRLHPRVRIALCSTPSARSEEKDDLLHSRRDAFKKAATAVLTTSAALSLHTPHANAATSIRRDNNNYMGGLGGDIAFGTEEIMSQKAYGSTEDPIQQKLRYGVSRELAETVCCHNRHFAESQGYFETTSLLQDLSRASGPVVFYDSVEGRPLFVAPRGRSVDEFLRESSAHGWLTFRDGEVVWDNVRLLDGRGELVSVDGAHLGHFSFDNRGPRYAVNLVSIAGYPAKDMARRDDEIRAEIISGRIGR